MVGGAVRDEILNHKCNDYDYAVEADSYDLMKKHLIENDFEIYREKPEYGTIKAKCPKTKLVCDYALCREDGTYSDSRRPDSIKISNISNDLSRRDFTMNAIAKIVHPDGSYEYYDPYNGIDDIDDKLIKCVGSANDRLMEDPLRGLRALRFSVTKGFYIDNEIISTINTKDFIEIFKTLPEERILDELSKMFKHDTSKSIRLLYSYPYIMDIMFKGDIWLMPTVKRIK